MHRPLAVLLANLALCLCLVLPTMARAESAADVAAARELYIEGARLSKEGQWEEAVERLGRSLAIKRAAITHYTLAVAQQKTGRLVAALENFRAFLAEPAAPATDGLREPASRAVEELSGRVGRVAMRITPAALPSLEVRIDGELVHHAALDVPRLVNPGRHEVVASAPGYTPAIEKFAIAEGRTVELALELSPLPVAPPPPPEPIAPKEPPAAKQPPSAAAATPPPTARPGPPAETAPAAPEYVEPIDRSFPVGGAVLLTGGLLALGTGITVGLLGVSEADDSPTQEGAVADSARSKALAGDIVAGVGIAATTIGLLVLIVDAATDDEPAAASPSAGRARAPRASQWVHRSRRAFEVRF